MVTFQVLFTVHKLYFGRKKEGIVDWDIVETLLLSSDTENCLDVDTAFGQICSICGLVENQLVHDKVSELLSD